MFLFRALSRSTGSLLFVLVLLPSAAAWGQTDLRGTTDNMPTEVLLPAGDTQPALTFRNRTGVRICDLVISRRVGAFNITGALLDDPLLGVEDWDVDDDRMNGLDDPDGVGGNPAENSTAAAAEGAGAAALGHVDNVQAGAAIIRIEEDGLNGCVRPNRNFEITFTFSAAPVQGDKLSIQPTNNLRANLYALIPDGAENCSETSWTLDPTSQVNTLFATYGPPSEKLYLSLRLEPVETGLTLVDLSVDAPATIDLSAGTVIFDDPVSSFELQGELSAFGTLLVAPLCVDAIPTTSTWGLRLLVLFLLAAGAFVLWRRRALGTTTLFLMPLLILLATPGAAQTELPGTTGNMPTEFTMPIGDAQPALTFTNRTGVPVCDLIITRTVGPWNITGALVGDENTTMEDWDVDDNQAGGLGAGESTAAPAGEGAGPAALTHVDNTQAAAASIRVEEVGNNHCVNDNRNFQVTLTLSAAPTQAGDTITVQPTNARSANIYALRDPLESDLCAETSWTLDPATQLNTLFAAYAHPLGILFQELRLEVVETGTSLVDLTTDVPAAVDLASGTIVFDRPVSSFHVEGELSGFGTILVSPLCVDPVPTLDSGALLLLGLLLLAAAAFVLRRQHSDLRRTR